MRCARPWPAPRPTPPPGRPRRTETSAFGRELLTVAVATPSPSGREAEAVGRIADALERHVDRVERDAVGNLVVTRGHGPTSILFLGHVDTVPGDVPVATRDGRLYGRGTVDAKGPLCAALTAVAEMDASLAARLTVRVVGAVGEEAPGSVGARHAVASLPPPDLLVVCEPSGWDAVTLGYKGHVRLELACERPSGHSAGPEASAADRLVTALARLRSAVATAQRERPPERAFDALQATVLDLAHRHDGLRERADATVGVRLPLDWPPDRLVALVGATDLGEEVTWRAGDAVAAVRGARDGPLARAFRVAVRRAGGRPRTVVKTGTSDWNVVAEAWPVPTLAYGPGDAGLDHAPDEHIVLAEYDAATDVLGYVLKHVAETPRAGG